ncbi:hypothetical protein A2U01_0104024, partial [Trifolium medium]|nr:hypothetical protein [Trifolium medium]
MAAGMSQTKTKVYCRKREPDKDEGNIVAGVSQTKMMVNCRRFTNWTKIK